MVIEKKPFVNYTLGEKDITDSLEQGKVFSIRLSAGEFRELAQAMEVLHISNHSTALKFLALTGKNVIFSIFNPEYVKWLTDGSRRVDDSKLVKLTSKKTENVTQNMAT